MKIETLTKKDVWKICRNELIERLARSEIDLVFWTNMGVNPKVNLNIESTKDIRKRIQVSKQMIEKDEKILEIIEKKLEEK